MGHEGGEEGVAGAGVEQRAGHHLVPRHVVGRVQRHAPRDLLAERRRQRHHPAQQTVGLGIPQFPCLPTCRGRPRAGG